MRDNKINEIKYTQGCHGIMVKASDWGFEGQRSNPVTSSTFDLGWPDEQKLPRLGLSRGTIIIGKKYLFAREGSAHG